MDLEAWKKELELAESFFNNCDRDYVDVACLRLAYAEAGYRQALREVRGNSCPSQEGTRAAV